MNRKKSYNISEGLYNKIINVAYGDANIIDKIKIRLLANKNPEVMELLNEFKETSNAVRSIEKEEFSEEYIKAIKRKVGIEEKKKLSFFYDFYSFVFSRPIVSVSTAVVLIVLIVSSALIKRPDVTPAYSQEQVQLANQQAKQALAIIGKIFNKTSTTLKEEILTQRVGKPINQGLNLVNDLFNEENKNEKLN